MASTCNVIVISCSHKDSEALLKNIKESGKSQASKFKDGYIIELLLACNANLGEEAEEYLFVAIKQDSNTGLTDICGFARVTKGIGEGEKRLQLESIATKGHSDTSYKGVGRSLIEKIKIHFERDPSIIGLFVKSEVPSVGFYKSVGFEPMRGERNPRYMFLSFR